MTDELELIRTAAPYLIPFFGVLFLIVFVKRYLFQGMMSAETYKDQMEREKLVLVHYQNVTTQLTDIMNVLREITIAAALTAHKMEDLAKAIDESIVNQILRLTPEERLIIKDMRNRQPVDMLLRQP
jgi:hypothetical protein